MKIIKDIPKMLLIIKNYEQRRKVGNKNPRINCPFCDKLYYFTTEDWFCGRNCREGFTASCNWFRKELNLSPNDNLATIKKALENANKGEKQPATYLTKAVTMYEDSKGNVFKTMGEAEESSKIIGIENDLQTNLFHLENRVINLIIKHRKELMRILQKYE